MNLIRKFFKLVHSFKARNMSQHAINQIFGIVKKSLKAAEPAIMVFSGTYLLTQGIQKKNFPLGLAGGLLVFRGGVDLGKIIEEHDPSDLLEEDK